MDTISFTVQLIGDQAFNVTLPRDSSMSELAKILEKHLPPDIDLQTVKLLHKAKVLRLNQYASLEAAGITNGAKIKLMASKKADIAAVQQAQEPPAMPSFEHEEQRERARQSTHTSSTASTETRFARLEEWNLPRLSPPPSAARALLQHLASDPGILGVMKKHGWKVELLSEMPPEGKVGISPVCLLGFNMNKGQEISLRLRTDDLKGFRRYDSIRLTLIHELAHMVHSEHDIPFKELNSQLRRELDALDWRGAPGARTAGGPAAAISPTLALGQAAAAATATAAGGRVGGSTLQTGVDARDAAATAALRRAKASNLTSFPVEIESANKEGKASEPPQQQEQPPPKKGDDVMYKQRDGTWVPAKVVAVDVSVQPPSYGIELPTVDGGNYRETEMNRLRAVQSKDEERRNGSGGGGAGVIEEYAPHYDPQTEATEAEVHRRFE